MEPRAVLPGELKDPGPEFVTVKYHSAIEGKWIEVEVTTEVATFLKQSDWATRKIERGKEIPFSKYFSPSDTEDEDEQLQVLDESSVYLEELRDYRNKAIEETQRDCLKHALRSLTPFQRKCISKKFYEGRWRLTPKSPRSNIKIRTWEEKTNVQIAKELGSEESIIRNTIKRGLRNIHKFFRTLKYHEEIFEDYHNHRYGFPAPERRVFEILERTF